MPFVNRAWAQTVEINMLHWQGLTDLTYRDYRPLMMVNRDAAALFVRQDAPWSDLEALTEAARRDPGKLRASGTGKGGIWHLALAGWLRTAGLGSDDVTIAVKSSVGTPASASSRRSWSDDR